jgi:hypothetical protein
MASLDAVRDRCGNADLAAAARAVADAEERVRRSVGADSVPLEQERAEAMLRAAIAAKEIVERYAFVAPATLGVVCAGLEATVAQQQRTVVEQQKELNSCRVGIDAYRLVNDKLCMAMMQLRSTVDNQTQEVFEMGEKERCEIEAGILESQEATLEAVRVERFETESTKAALKRKLEAVQRTESELQRKLEAVCEERDLLASRAHSIPTVLNVCSRGRRGSNHIAIADLLGIYTISETSLGDGFGYASWDHPLPTSSKLIAENFQAHRESAADEQRVVLHRTSDGEWIIGRESGVGAGEGWITSTSAGSVPLGLQWQVWNEMSKDWELDTGLEVVEL